MKTLVIYHSLTGTTKKVANIIAKNLNADLDEIVDVKKLGDKAAGKPVEISYKKDPKKYDLVVLGAPVWAFHLSPFLKAYAKENKLTSVAFFTTYAIFTGIFFHQLKRLTAIPKATLKLKMKKLDENKIKEFTSILEKV